MSAKGKLGGLSRAGKLTATRRREIALMGVAAIRAKKAAKEAELNKETE